MIEIPGHECNAYCRPDEGLHCTSNAFYRGEGASSEEWWDQYQERIEDGLTFMEKVPEAAIVKAERAPEAPPQERKIVPPGYVYDGMVLTWFRVPVEEGVGEA